MPHRMRLKYGISEMYHNISLYSFAGQIDHRKKQTEVLPMIYHKTMHFAISDIPDKVIIRVIMHCRDIATLIVHTKMNIQHH